MLKLDLLNKIKNANENSRGDIIVVTKNKRDDLVFEIIWKLTVTAKMPVAILTQATLKKFTKNLVFYVAGIKNEFSVSKSDWPKLTKAAEDLSALGIDIYNVRGSTWLNIKNKINQSLGLATSHPRPNYIVIDGLENQRLSVLGKLRKLAKEIKIPIVVIAK